MPAQPGILADIPEHCRYLEFLARSDTDAVVLGDWLSGFSKIGGDLVVALGSDLAEKFGADAEEVAGLVVASTLMSVAALPVLLAILL